jgi:DNA-binding transcriptional regulator YhcF (GntR family)
LADKKYLEKAVAALIKLVNDSETDELPSLEELSASCNIGVNTMLKAIRVLETRGLLDCRQGRRARIARNKTPEEKSGEKESLRGSAGALLAILKQEMVEGKLKTGSSLPKTVYLAAKMRMSHRNIVKVLRRLQQEKFIHKQGKKWIVGTQDNRAAIPIEPEIHLGKNARVVIILSRKLNDFKSIEKNDRLSSYYLELIDELEKCSIRILLCGTDSAENGEISPAGLYNVENLIRSIGDKYAGCIIAPHLYPEPVESEISQWLTLMHSGGRPVVWCDVENLGENHLNRSMSSDKNSFYSILQDRASAISLALGTLTGAGHTRICCPYYSDVNGMTNHSLEVKNLCLEIAAKDFPSVTIYPVKIGGLELDNSQSMWDKRHAYATPRELLNYLKKRNPASSFKQQEPTSQNPAVSRQELLDAMPFMSELIFEKGVTAILGPNDFFICQLYGWLSLLHVKVPNDISLISFDNSSLIRLYPLAAIDWGLRSGAYLAVRLILGDIPVHTGKNGVVYLKSRLFDRGSIGTAKRVVSSE